MKRRQFLQSFLAVSAIPLLPSIACAQPLPTNIAELTDAIEKMFPPIAMGSTRAFEEFPVMDKVVRFTHKTFMLGTKITREELDDGVTIEDEQREVIQEAYRRMRAISDMPEFRDAKLMWRMQPHTQVEAEFDTNMVFVAVRWRASIMRKGWESGVEDMDELYSGIQKPQGFPAPTIRLDRKGFVHQVPAIISSEEAPVFPEEWKQMQEDAARYISKGKVIKESNGMVLVKQNGFCTWRTKDEWNRIKLV